MFRPSFFFFLLPTSSKSFSSRKITSLASAGELLSTVPGNCFRWKIATVFALFPARNEFSFSLQFAHSIAPKRAFRNGSWFGNLVSVSQQAIRNCVSQLSRWKSIGKTNFPLLHHPLSDKFLLVRSCKSFAKPELEQETAAATPSSSSFPTSPKKAFRVSTGSKAVRVSYCQLEQLLLIRLPGMYSTHGFIRPRTVVGN